LCSIKHFTLNLQKVKNKNWVSKCYYFLMSLPEKFTKPYNAAETEDRISKLWEESGFFNPDNLPGDRKEVFSMVLPPPNVTGVLHMGHALTITLEDIMTRFHRMKGASTLWIPGADHAAVATQAKVENEIYKKEGKTRKDLGREELLRRIIEFAEASKETIIKQTKRMGASVDWSRFAFTLDEKRSFAVRTAFGFPDGLAIRDLGHFVVRGLDHTVRRVGQQILWPLSTQKTVNRGKPVGHAPRVLRTPECA